MKQKNLLSLLLFLIAALTTNAYDFEVDGIYYGFMYNDETGVYVAFPKNDDYGEEGMISNYNGDMVIPETVYYCGHTYTVKAIGDRAFYYSGITTISIPETVTYIGENAFNSSCLTRLVIPKSVTFLERWALAGCSMVESIVVASENPVYDSRDNCNAVIETSSNTLIAGCRNTVIPPTVNEIGESAFESQWQLESITIPNSVTKIGGSAFAFSGIRSIDIPNSVTSIEDHAFYNCSWLTNLVFPNSVAFIPDNVCQSCSKLTSVTIPNSVTTIGKEAFYSCTALSNVTIPNSVTTIGTRAFSHCKNLTDIVIPGSVNTIGEWAFSSCSNLASVNIPNSVTTIKRYAFSNCTSLTSVTIPSSVTVIGDGVFSECTSLTSIIVESENPVYDSRDNCNAIIESSSNKLLQGCRATIIPNTVTKIREYAFFNCKGLTTIAIPNSIIEIGNGAFSGCNNLNTVYSHISDLAQVTVGSTPFYRSPGGSSDRTLYVPSGTLADYQADNKWSQYFDFIVEMEGEPGEVEAEITTDVSAITFDPTYTGYEGSRTVLITGTNLLSDLELCISNDNTNSFSLSKNSITPEAAAGGAPVTVYFNPTTGGGKHAILEICYAGNKVVSVPINGTAIKSDGYITAWPTELSFETSVGEPITKTFEVFYSYPNGSIMISNVSGDGETGSNVEGRSVTLSKPDDIKKKASIDNSKKPFKKIIGPDEPIGLIEPTLFKTLVLELTGDDCFDITPSIINLTTVPCSTTVTVTYHPEYMGENDATITIKLSGGSAKPYILPLHGTATGQLNAANNNDSLLDTQDDMSIPAGASETADVNELAMNSKIYAEGKNIIIETAVEQRAMISDIAGRVREVNLMAGRNEVPVNASGIYIVRIKEKSVKLMLK